MSERLEKYELEEKVDRYINGELSADEVDEFWAELIQNEDQLDYLKNAANLKAVIRQKKQKKSGRKTWYYAAAAAVALLIALVTFTTYFVQTSSTVAPLEHVELNYYRSADALAANMGESDIIRKAIMLANSGKSGEAITLLKGELEKATKPAWISKLSLSTGSLYYNLGNYAQAIEYYTTVIDNKEHIDVLMLEKAYWYRGNAYFQTDRLTKALENIQKAYDLNGAYRRVTESYLKAMSSVDNLG